jgi:TMEM175 potassium channel family protein
MSESGDRFSKARLEMLCDGIFCVAMTLLVLELKPPDLPKQSEPAAIWHALREHALPFLAFALTFVLAGGSWIMHHRLFQHIRGANRALVLLTIPFLMFVTLLPFSTSMLTAFGTRNQVGLTFYIGNQLVLSSLLAIQWLIAQRAGLLTGSESDPDRRRLARILLAQPASFLLALVVAQISPNNAMAAVAISIALATGLARRIDRPAAARATAS